MKKKAALIAASAVGIAGGVGYLLTRKKGGKNGLAEDVDVEAQPASMWREQQSSEDQRLDAKQDLAQETRVSDEPEVLDDRGTDQAEAHEMLRQVRDAAFEGSDEKLALALGRPAQEIEQWTSGAGRVDGDVVLKARGLANQRGIEIGG
jgi:hypothetical protein